MLLWVSRPPPSGSMCKWTDLFTKLKENQQLPPSCKKKNPAKYKNSKQHSPIPESIGKNQAKTNKRRENLSKYKIKGEELLENGIPNISMRGMKIDFNRKSGHVVVWSDQELDRGKNEVLREVPAIHTLEDSSNDGIELCQSNFPDIPKSISEVSISFEGNMKAENSRKVEEVSGVLAEGIGNPGPTHKKRARKKRTSKTNMETNTDSDLISRFDLDKVVETSKHSCWDSVNKKVHTEMKNIAEFIVKNMELGSEQHLLDIEFNFKEYNTIIEPLSDHFSASKQLLVLQVLMMNLIERLYNKNNNTEYSRRAFSLLAQFQQKKIKDQWREKASHLPLDVKEIAWLLEVEQDWPLFEHAEIETFNYIMENMEALHPNDQLQLDTLFLFEAHVIRLLTMKYRYEARMNHYQLSFSDEELEAFEKWGFSIPLVLRLDISLELSSQEMSWKNTSSKQKYEKTIAIYLALNGICTLSDVPRSLVPVQWSVSPIRELMLRESTRSQSFDTRMKDIIKFGKVQRSESYTNWLDRHASASWENTPINPGEALAATYSGIHLKYVAQLKHWFKMRRLKSIFKRKISRMQNHSSHENHMENWYSNSHASFSDLIYWPRKKEEEEELPKIILYQREKFVKYFDLLELPIPMHEHRHTDPSDQF